MTNAGGVNIVKEIASQIGAEYEPRYSGRAMYGTSCVAIRCERYEVDSIIALAERDGLKGARQDATGLGAIVYWPSIKEDLK